MIEALKHVPALEHFSLSVPNNVDDCFDGYTNPVSLNLLSRLRGVPREDGQQLLVPSLKELCLSIYEEDEPDFDARMTALAELVESRHSAITCTSLRTLQLSLRYANDARTNETALALARLESCCSQSGLQMKIWTYENIVDGPNFPSNMDVKGFRV